MNRGEVEVSHERALKQKSEGDWRGEVVVEHHNELGGEVKTPEALKVEA